jgi:hypothetical protein
LYLWREISLLYVLCNEIILLFLRIYPTASSERERAIAEHSAVRVTLVSAKGALTVTVDDKQKKRGTVGILFSAFHSRL